MLTGTGPDYPNASVTVCHETEPYCAAFRLGRRIRASVCLARTDDGRFVVLSPCGVCRERLAVHGPDTLVAVPGTDTASTGTEDPAWVSLRSALPHYWLLAFPDEVPAWAGPPAADPG